MLKAYLTILGVCLLTAACAAPPKQTPKDLAQFTTAEQLANASKQAYRQARAHQKKSQILKYTQAGMMYSDKCLQQDPEQAQCLYYHVINRGLFVKHHFSKYQESLKIMVERCHLVLKIQPEFEKGGCYRVLGNIYSKVPSFSMTSGGITRDLDKALDYFRQAVAVAPDHALNHLFLARTLEKLEENQEARKVLKKFDSLPKEGLDKDYPEWKKEREKLSKKLKVN